MYRIIYDQKTFNALLLNTPVSFLSGVLVAHIYIYICMYECVFGCMKHNLHIFLLNVTMGVTSLVGHDCDNMDVR